MGWKIFHKNKQGKRSNLRFESVINFFRLPDSKRSNSTFGLDRFTLMSYPKTSQITIFIVLTLAILLVIFLLFFRNLTIVELFLGKSPEAKIEDCTREAIQEGITLVSAQGGVINPVHYYLYKDNKIEYLCYTEESFKTCVMQKGLFKDSIEKELKEYLEPKLNDCVSDLTRALEHEGKEVSVSTPTLGVVLIPNSVLVTHELNLIIQQGENHETYKTIKTNVHSSLYNFAIIASDIANSEAQYGDAETLIPMYRDKTIKVEKIKEGDETKVYILTDRLQGDQFYFAIKSIPIPPGWIETEKF